MSRILKKHVGILALKGTYMHHESLFPQEEVFVSYVRTVQDIEAVDALVIPGVFDTVSLEVQSEEWKQALQIRLAEGMPLLLTGGAVMFLSEYNVLPKKCHIHMTSKAPFVQSSVIDIFDAKPYELHGYNAYTCTHFPKETEVYVEEEDGFFVKIRNILAISFFPEWGSDTRIHEYFLTLI